MSQIRNTGGKADYRQGNDVNMEERARKECNKVGEKGSKEKKAKKDGRQERQEDKRQEGK